MSIRPYDSTSLKAVPLPDGSIKLVGTVSCLDDLSRRQIPAPDVTQIDGNLFLHKEDIPAFERLRKVSGHLVVQTPVIQPAPSANSKQYRFETLTSIGSTLTVNHMTEGNEKISFPNLVVINGSLQIFNGLVNLDLPKLSIVRHSFAVNTSGLADLMRFPELMAIGRSLLEIESRNTIPKSVLAPKLRFSMEPLRPYIEAPTFSEVITNEDRFWNAWRSLYRHSQDHQKVVRTFASDLDEAHHSSSSDMTMSL